MASDGGQKQGQDINGYLKWYRFDFTLDNLFDILSKSSKHSIKCIQLPQSFATSGQDWAAELPGIADPSPQDMEVKYAIAFKKGLSALNQKNLPEFQTDDAFAEQFLKNLSGST